MSDANLAQPWVEENHHLRNPERVVLSTLPSRATPLGFLSYLMIFTQGYVTLATLVSLHPGLV